MALQLAEFPDFVREAFGYRPFPWQEKYLHAVADGAPWPDLDVPTGLGKTSLIDIWTFLLAWQTAHDHPRTAPLRLFFVVDRRLVVDQAHRHAEQLRHTLETAEPGSVAARVAEQLRRLGGEPAPLAVVRMRGGVDWASRWLTSPAQPAVVTATVDQYGSRLLFRGYHTSALMRPVDAALCGMDALLAVDEAHIALPLLTTAADCAAYQATAAGELSGRAVQVVSLSATASTDPHRPRLGIDEKDGDWTNPVAGLRLRAHRRVTALDATGLHKDPATCFARAAVRAVEALLPVVDRPVLAVVANTIATARAAHHLLVEQGEWDTLLLTGRSRRADREHLLAGPHLRELLDGVRPDRKRPLVAVATQTVEVGLDVSVAGMVTEIPALSALVQRLGRLNRTGTDSAAAAVVVRAHPIKDPADIPVYGAAADRTWHWLTTHTHPVDAAHADATAMRQAVPNGTLVNPETLPALLQDTDPQRLNPPRPRTPVLHRTLLDSWARTSPPPVPDQAPAPFLHGLQTEPADIHVLWRADLPTTPGRPPAWDTWTSRMRQLPPHPGETVAIPARQLRRFLTQPSDAEPLSDLEGATEPGTPQPAPARGRQPAPALRRNDDTTRRDEEEWLPVTGPDDLRPGSTIVLPSDYAGHDAYGWTGRPGRPVPDFGDFPPGRDLTTTRLDPAVLAGLADADDTLRDTLAETITTAVRRLQAGEEEQPPTAVVHDLLDRLLDHLSPDEPEDAPLSRRAQLRERLTRLRDIHRWDLAATGRSTDTGHVVIDPEDPARLVLTPPRAQPGRPDHAPGVGDDSAEASSLTRPVSLAQHGKAVAARAAAYAERLALPAPLVAAVDTGAHAHDVGKTHPRFQTMLCAGDQLLAETLAEPLAKSGMDPADLPARRRAARLARWEGGLRHEALSAVAVRRWLATRSETAGDEADPELIVHLVAAHHGHARPLLPPVTDPEPAEVNCTMPDGRPVTVHSSAMGVDWDGPDRFAALNRRYGPWGLALLEAIVRLADMACSEEGS